MAGTGGKRKGAGRPKGARNKRTKASVALVAKKGSRSPLEFLLDAMNDPSKSFDIRLEAAGKAAPYVHPKLANTEVNLTGELELDGMTDDQCKQELIELLKDPAVAAALGAPLPSAPKAPREAVPRRRAAKA